MENILIQGKDIIHAVASIIGILSILATVVVRLTPSKKDDEAVLALGGKIWKVIQWLPTMGINPQTKALIDSYHAVKAELEAVKTKEAAKPA